MDIIQFYDQIADAMEEEDKKKFSVLFNRYRKYFKEALIDICNKEYSRGKDNNVEFIRLSAGD